MTMNYQYLDLNNQPAGPATLEQIRNLAASGSIPADPQVAPEGSADWRPLSHYSDSDTENAATATGSGGSAKPKSLPSGTIMADFVGSTLGRIAGWLSPAWVERSLDFSTRIGHYAVLVGSALTLCYAIFAAIKYNSFATFLTGLGFIAALAVAQFAAKRFLGAAQETIRSTPSRISSTAFLECVGLIVLLAAAAILIGSIGTAIRMESVIPIVPAFFGAAILSYFGALALHPSLVNVSPGEGTSGEEAIGLISFFFKSLLKLVPLLFFLTVVAGGLAVLASFFESGRAFANTIVQVFGLLPLPVALPYGLAGAGVILTGCLLPIIAYFTYLLWYLLLDVLRAILSIPAKLDTLNRKA